MIGIRVHGLAYILTDQPSTPVATNTNNPWSEPVVTDVPMAGVPLAPVKRWAPKRFRANRAHLIVVE